MRQYLDGVEVGMTGQLFTPDNDELVLNYNSVEGV